VAIHADPRILVMDEGFMVGDVQFRQKCMKKINRLFVQKKTVIMVSQMLDFLQMYCKRIVFLEQGTVVRDKSSV
jgi:ABC-type polysaccharide/polyol phosphate transport system ATPase subunit